MYYAQTRAQRSEHARPDATKRLLLLDTRIKEGRGAWFDPSHRPVLAKLAAEPGHVLIEVENAKLDGIAIACAR